LTLIEWVDCASFLAHPLKFANLCALQWNLLRLGLLNGLVVLQPSQETEQSCVSRVLLERYAANIGVVESKVSMIIVRRGHIVHPAIFDLARYLLLSQDINDRFDCVELEFVLVSNYLFPDNQWVFCEQDVLSGVVFGILAKALNRVVVYYSRSCL